MLKFTTAQVTFSEVPDEISLVIEISNCPYHCPACHSKQLWEDVGEELDFYKVSELVKQNEGITCICFMGGDGDLEELYYLFDKCILFLPYLKIAWYTGRESIPENLPLIDYIKIGPYIENRGPINNPNTNQRFYTRGSSMKKMDVSQRMWYDTTDKFWNNDN